MSQLGGDDGTVFVHGQTDSTKHYSPQTIRNGWGLKSTRTSIRSYLPLMYLHIPRTLRVYKFVRKICVQQTRSSYRVYMEIIDDSLCLNTKTKYPKPKSILNGV